MMLRTARMTHAEYMASPVWHERSRRHRRRRPWCLAHGQPCHARQTHHASYWGRRRLGVELPWELVGLCDQAHERVSRHHAGRWVPSRVIFAWTWWVIITSRLEVLMTRWGGFEPRPRRRGWDATWRVALLVLAALVVFGLLGWLLELGRGCC